MKILILIPIILLLNCSTYQSAPTRGQNELEICFQFRDCMYRNKLNPDKTICKDLDSECRTYSRFEYCQDPNNRPEMKFQECWDKLNSK